MVDFSLSAEQLHWQAKAKEMAAVFAQRARAYDEAGEYPRQNMNELRDAGFLKLAVPKQYGGLGSEAGFCAWLPHLVIEEIATECGGTGWCLMTHYHACGLIAGLGSEEQKTRIFADVVNNGALIATLGSEVQPQQMKARQTKAGPLVSWEAGMEPVEGGFIANARKGFCSTAKEADYIIYWSQAPGTSGGGDGLTMSIIPKDTKGISFLPGWEDAIGLRCSESGGAMFENVFIPWENVMGQPGDYVQVHPYTFELSYAMFLLGLAQGAYNFLRNSLKEREFLQEDDTVMYALGEMSSEIQATRMSCWYTQWLWDQKDYEEAHQSALRALHQAKTTSLKVATRGFDVIGVRGLFKFNPLERIWRDIRTATLHTRESQFMRLLSLGELRGQKFVKQKYGNRVSTRKTWNDLLGDDSRKVAAEV
jgi:alkylation response protein AidB-like acyl-CoA dehydrogenase